MATPHQPADDTMFLPQPSHQPHRMLIKHLEYVQCVLKILIWHWTNIAKSFEKCLSVLRKNVDYVLENINFVFEKC